MTRARAAAALALVPLIGAFALDAFHVELPAVLLGARFGLDATGRVFVAAYALLWLAVALHSPGGRRAGDPRARCAPALLVAALASFALPLAGDAPGFYLASVLLTLATAAIVATRATAAGTRAARALLVMAVVGDGLLLDALLHLTHESDGPLLADLAAAAADDPAACLLLVVAFGTKAGVALLHAWLPPTCAALRPAPAALVTGTLALAGMLGWLRFLPLGVADVRGVGLALAVAGFAAALLAPAIGLVQRGTRAAIAYAIVASAGLVAVGVGGALMSAHVASVLADALPAGIVAHALAAAALLLGAQGRRGRAAVLALVGAPLVPGIFAAASVTLALPPAALAPVALAVFGAALLGADIARRLAAPRTDRLAVPRVGSLAIVVGAAVASSAVVVEAFRAVGAPVLVWTSVAPALAGFAVFGAVARAALRWGIARAIGHVPPGDVLALAERVAGFLRPRLLAALALPDRVAQPVRAEPPRLHVWLDAMERRLRGARGAGVALVVVIAVLALA